MSESLGVKTTDERYRVLLESSPLVPWEADATTWRFSYVGPQAEALLGFPVEAWYSDNFWTQQIHPDDREHALALCERLCRERSSYQFEYRMVRADGSIVWICDVVSVEMRDGEPDVLRGFLIDVSDRKESEDRLQLMADALPAAIAYVDKDQRYQFVNQAYEDWFGIPTTEVVGKTLEEFLGQEMYRSLGPQVERVLSGEHIKYRSHLRGPDGVRRHFDASFVPHQERGGEVLGYFSLVLDSTTQVEAEEEARHTRDQIAHVSRVATMGELATSMAHELNQPLSAIVSNAQAAMRFLTAKEPDTGEVGDALADIADDAKRASDVIRRMRSLLSGGKPQRAALDLNGLVEGVAALLNSDAISRRIKVTLDLANDLPKVMCDSIQIQQVILNLMVNGFEAMSHEGIVHRELTVRSAARENAVAISVTDTGIGLDPDGAKESFEPFVTTKEGGMGMGLTICRSIVEAHDGGMLVDADAEAGTTFHIDLPTQP
jgi:PAS domain S-box-containing protein